jgi:hypothetical protein
MRASLAGSSARMSTLPTRISPYPARASHEGKKLQQPLGYHLERREIAAVHSGKERAAAAIGFHGLVHALEIGLIECFEQYEEPLLARAADESRERVSGQHADDQQDAAGASDPRLEHLVGIDEEVLAHRGDTQRCERGRRCGEVGQGPIESARLGEHGYRGGARARIRRDTLGQRGLRRTECARSG